VTPSLGGFFAACAAGDLARIRELLAQQPGFVHERHDGSTALHAAIAHPDALRLLIEHGADPNARDDGDNALALHFAVGGAPIESVRVLLDGGSDVHGAGDLHQLEVIGWATVFGEARRDVVDLLVERGARHHVFSAIALADLDLLRRVVHGEPAALSRRLSRYEQDQTALHYVIAPPDGLVGGLFRTGAHYRTLELLIELGADLEATDAKGRTPLAVAMLRADRDAMRRLHAAGATIPVFKEPAAESSAPPAASIKKLTPMFGVANMEATVAWYQSIGFDLAGTHGDDGTMRWACVRLGNVEIMFVPSDAPWRHATAGLSVWIYTDRIDDIYAKLKRRQMQQSRAVLTGESTAPIDVPFVLDLHTAFYGQREFGIRDPNGIHVMFAQSIEG
jgi:ankyrin repeat protein